MPRLSGVAANLSAGIASATPTNCFSRLVISLSTSVARGESLAAGLAWFAAVAPKPEIKSASAQILLSGFMVLAFLNVAVRRRTKPADASDDSADYQRSRQTPSQCSPYPS